MKKRLWLLPLLCTSAAVYLFIYTRYTPQVISFQLILAPLIILTAVWTAFSVYRGTLAVIFFIPLLNSLPYFFNFQGFNPLLFLFYGYLLGFLANRIFAKEKMLSDAPLQIPVLFLISLVSVSGLFTLWRYTNFFPLFETTVYDLTVNVFHVSSGEAIRRVLLDYLNYLGGLIWFLILIRVIRQKKHQIQLVKTLALSTGLAVVFGVIQALISPELGNTTMFISLERINALFTDPNAFGVFLALVLPVFMASALILPNRWLFLLLPPLIGGILLQPYIGSRSSLAGLILAFLIFIFIWYWNKARFEETSVNLKKYFVYFLIFIILAGGTAAVFSIYNQTTLYKRISENIKALTKPKGLEAISRGRWRLWKGAATMIRKDPLHGVGLGAFTVEIPNYYFTDQIAPVMPFSYYNVKKPEMYWVDTAGNFYIQIAAESGLFGLLLFLWIFFLFLKRIHFRLFRQPISTKWDIFSLGVSTGILVVLLIFLFGTHTINFEIQLTLWLLTALLVVNTRNSRIEKIMSRKSVWAGIFLLCVYSGVFAYNSFTRFSLDSKTWDLNLEHSFGFYQEEKMEGRNFRWTKQKAAKTLFIRGEEMHIPLLASHPDINKREVKVNIYAVRGVFRSKHLLKKVSLSNGQWHTVQIPVRNFSREKILLLFDISRTWSPKTSLGIPDPRRLGIGVGDIRFPRIANPWDFSPALGTIVYSAPPAAWGGPLGNFLYTEGASLQYADLAQGRHMIHLEASGSQARGIWPYMLMTIDDRIRRGRWVTNEKIHFIPFPATLGSGEHKIEVSFLNDGYDKKTKDDRNLWLGSLFIYQRE